MKKIIFGILLLLTAVCCTKPIVPPVDEEDNYYGDNRLFSLKEVAKNFHKDEAVCYIRVEGGPVITRSVSHLRSGDTSFFDIKNGLKDGNYRLLYFESDSSLNYPLGTMVQASQGVIKITNKYDGKLGFYGSGTEEDPYIICSDADLLHLSDVVNDWDTRLLIRRETHFSQTEDINASFISFYCDNVSGWTPIGNDITIPFVGQYDGHGHRISGLNINRPFTVGVGLFGFIKFATLQNIHLADSRVTGAYGVGGIAGCVISSGAEVQCSAILKCRVSSSKFNYDENDNPCLEYGIGVGGLVGSVDQHTAALIDSCSIGDGSAVAGASAVGGILGSGVVTSHSIVAMCDNNSTPVSSGYSSAGGLIGSADSIHIFSCRNNGGEVSGQKLNDPDMGIVGAGGIIGGSGCSIILGCKNMAPVTGNRGVGGILGTTYIGEDPNVGGAVYNEANFSSCSNTSSVTGKFMVGGICGEAQIGVLECYNTGEITATEEDSYVGGIVGGASTAAIECSSNFGKIRGKSMVAGLAGKTMLASVAIAENFGQVLGNGDKVGGIMGLTGNNSIAHYCSNYAEIYNAATGGRTGGIVGVVGNPNEWTSTDIADCVIGTIDIVAGVLGFGCMFMEGICKTAGWAVGEVVVKAIDILSETVVPLLDELFFTSGVISLCLPEPETVTEELKSQLTLDMERISSKRQELYSSKMAALSIPFPDGHGLRLSPISQQYGANRDQLLECFKSPENDYDNKYQIEHNLTIKRDSRKESIHEDQENLEILHTVIAGACIATTAIASVAAIAVSAFTAGATAATVPVIISVGSGIVSIVGGVNSFVKIADSFNENSTIISQCLNAGNIKHENPDKKGGIVGQLYSGCLVEDCLNAGKNIYYSDGAGIVGDVDQKGEINNCLNIGDGWYQALFYRGNSQRVDYTGNYYLHLDYNNSEYGTRLFDDDIYLKSTYKEWDFDGYYQKWSLPNETEGNYPVPYRSEMIKSVQE